MADVLRDLGIKFSMEADAGDFTVDFVLEGQKLAIEVQSSLTKFQYHYIPTLQNLDQYHCIKLIFMYFWMLLTRYTVSLTTIMSK